MSQVHKETLTAVDNALPNRAGLDIEIFGMEGIPEEIVQQHNQRVLQTYHQAQADRAAHNHGGAAGGNASKKPKVEDKMTLKERLALHKAQKAAIQDGDGSTSGGNTPVASTVTPAPGTFVRNLISSLVRLLTLTQSGPSYQQPYTAPPTNGSYSQPPTYNPVQPVAPGFAVVQPPAAYGQHPGQLPYQPQPYAQPPGASFQQPQHSYPPQPAFSPSTYQQPPPFPSPYPSSNSPYPGQGGPRAFGAGTPPFIQHGSPPPQPNNFPKPVHTGTVSLPTALGLPQRPVVGAPPVSGFQFQQMHQGAIPPPHSHSPLQYQQQEALPPGVAPVSAATEMPTSSSLDDLITSALKHAESVSATGAPPNAQIPTNGTNAPVTVVAAPTDEKDKSAAKEEKKDKTDKSKKTRLVYSDEHISPEEKMAMLPRFAFTSQQTAIAA